MARQFSLSKSYKLLKWVVIIVTILSVYFCYLSIKNSEYFSKQFGIDSQFCSNKYSKEERDKMTQEEKQSAFAELDGCYALLPDTDINLKVEADKNIGITLAISVLLPILFFGGSWIIRYIFPKTK